MKLFIHIILCIVSLDAFAQTTIYYPAIEMPKSLHDNYYASMEPRLLAHDLADLLSQASGEKFTTQPHHQQTKGIILKLDASVQGNETGIVTISENVIEIRARYITGLSYAMYSWLNELGFRFYMPGEKWNYIPQLKNINAPFSKIYQPDFKLRFFGASGGLFAVKGLDESQNFRNDWFVFYRRNRMGAHYLRIDGHMGEKFNIDHKALIEKDTSILAPIDGVRKYGVSGKLDASNPNAVVLFVKWIVERFKKEQLSYPDFLPFKKYMSVDPGDGLNYCETPACKSKFPTISDQMYHVANATYEALIKANAAASVSTMAYSVRTDTPVMNIHPNIHTMVVPTAFQTVSTPAELMKRWSVKTNHFSQYDFLNIGVWMYDQPFFNLKQYVQYISYLKQIKAEGLSIETTQSSFAAGLPAWFILQSYAQSNLNTDSALNLFCKEMFENASDEILPVFKMFYFNDVHLKTQIDRPSFYADELGKIVYHLTEASKTKVLSATVKQRIWELKAYTIYLVKHYELFHDLSYKAAFDNAKINQAKRADELLNYTWKLYDQRIIHNTQINDLLKKIATDKDKWNFKTSDYNCFKGDHKKMVDNSFDTLRKAYSYIPFKTEISESVFQQLAKLSADSLLFQTQDEKAFSNFVYALPLYAPQAGKIKIKYEIGKSSGAVKHEQFALIALESDDYTLMRHHFIRKEMQHGTIELEIPRAGHYKLHLAQYQATPAKYIVYPNQNLFYLNKKTLPHNGILLQAAPHSNYDNAFIAVLKPEMGLPIFRLSHYTSKNTLEFYEANGEKVSIKTAMQPYSFELQTKHPSELIYFTNTVTRWPALFYNTEPYLFFLKKPEGNTFKRQAL